MNFLKKLLKVIGLLFLVILVALVTLLIAARFADGPWGLVAGGPFTSGQQVETPADWSFLKDQQEVEFELLVNGRSRTSWIAVVDNRVFIPSGYMNTTVGKLWKHWPFDAEEDGRIILRVDGKLYDMRMERRIKDPAIQEVLNELRRKYFPQVEGDMPLGEVESGNTWIFELLPR